MPVRLTPLQVRVSPSRLYKILHNKGVFIMSSRKEIEELLNEIFGDDNENCGETSKHEFPTETKGFQSLVTPVEYKAVCDLCNAVDKFTDLHNSEVAKIAGGQGDKSDYSMFQYMQFSEQISDLVKAIHLMKDIHNMDKDFIDDCAKEVAGGSVKRLLHLTLMKGLLDR